MKNFVCLLVFFLLQGLAIGENHEHDDHKNTKKSLKAHQHGLGKMNIVQDQNSLLLEIELPGFDVVGFEHEAKNKEDIKAVKASLRLLNNPKNIFEVPNDANCKAIKSEAEILSEGNHTEFVARYVLKCKNINKIDKIKILYFSNFNNGKKLNINVVGEKQISNFDLSKTINIININNHF